MNNTAILPALPNSDPESLARNLPSSYYDVKSRDYWKDADVSLHKVQDFQSCSHYFTQEGSQVRCTKCFIGFFGAGLHIQDGKLLSNNQVVL